MKIIDNLSITELEKLPIEPEFDYITGMLRGHTVSLLSSGPKLGKTTLAVQIANALSTKSFDLFGHTVDTCDVVYFCFDDSAANMKDRLRKMGIRNNDHFFIIFLKDANIDDLIPFIEKLKKNNPSIGLLVMDMLNDIRSINPKNEYSNYEVKSDILKLRNIAERNALAILLLHHNGKKNYTNTNNNALGGIQLTGTINGSIISIIRTSPNDPFAVLEISGRNVPSESVFLNFNSNTSSFDLADKQTIELRKDLVKIINYITKEKSFSGTIQQLSSILNLSSNPAKLGKELNTVQESFLENGVFIKKRKSNGVRVLELSLDPNFDVNGENIEGSAGAEKETVEKADPADPGEGQ